jgi:hypothetical protein
MSVHDLDPLERSLEAAAQRIAPPPQRRAAAAAARGRRRRVLRHVAGTVGAVALVAGVVVPLALLSPLGGEPAPQLPATGPTPSSTPRSATPSSVSSGRLPSVIDAAEGPMDGFVPPTRREGDLVVMPVTFPDGTIAELAYPPALDLAGEFLRPYSSGSLPGSAGRDFSISYGRVEDVLAQRGGATLLAEYPDGLGGTVGFWDLRAEREVNHLAFQFGSWAVLVYDYYPLEGAGPPMSEDAREQWVRSLRGHETETGFLVLEALPPLRLARAGEHAGPELQVGNLNPRFVLLFPGRCEQYRAGAGGFEEDELAEVDGIVMDRSSWFASWCDPGGLMRVHVYQARGDHYIDRVARGLEVREVRLAA